MKTLLSISSLVPVTLFAWVLITPAAAKEQPLVSPQSIQTPSKQTSNSVQPIPRFHLLHSIPAEPLQPRAMEAIKGAYTPTTSMSLNFTRVRSTYQPYTKR